MDELGQTKLSDIDSQTAKLGEYVICIQTAMRTGNVDKDELASLVVAAKGTRSMRRFAEDMGVNVSSVSRIVNGKVTEISDALLAKIACYADPESGVTLDKLMEAQGLVKKENRAALGSRYEEACRRIMADELLKRGYSVSYRESRPNEAYDFEIITDAIQGGRWLVETKMFSAGSHIPTGYGKVMWWLDAAMAYYYRGGEAGRISLVLDHATVFDHVKERMSGLVIPNEISTILVSTREGKIVEEYIAPLSSGRVPQKVFEYVEYKF